MWLCLSDAFLSIVAIPQNPELLKVRSRRPGDIDRLFPDATVSYTPGRDYLYRAEISRSDVSDVLAKLVAEIDYPNFKDSVDDRELHAAYGDLWRRMSKLRSLRPFSSK